MEELHSFCDEQLGKGVVPCRDTPGFLGNRVGCYAIQTALHVASDMGLSPTEADGIFGRPMGIPKTGVFGLYDLIGIDLMSDVSASLVSILPEGDDFHTFGTKLPLMTEMINNGQKGRKSGQGFYRNKDGEKQVINLKTGAYEAVSTFSHGPATKAEKDGIIHILEDGSRYGDYAWQVMSRVLVYAAGLIPEVGDTPVAVDDAMKMGYNWIKGPFELMDDIGVDYLINRLEKEQRDVPEFLKQAAGKTFYQTDDMLSTLKNGGGSVPVIRPEGAMRFNDHEVDGVSVVEFHSKANALGSDSMKILDQAIDYTAKKNLIGLIIHNDAQHFSCGADLREVRSFFEAKNWDGLDRFLDHFQQTDLKMARAPFPVVAAPVGLSLGGGFEVVLHAKQVICHANSNMGLVESGVGLIPGGGGCKETLYRCVRKRSIAGWRLKNATWKLRPGRPIWRLGMAKQRAHPCWHATWLCCALMIVISIIATDYFGPNSKWRVSPCLIKWSTGPMIWWKKVSFIRMMLSFQRSSRASLRAAK